MSSPGREISHEEATARRVVRNWDQVSPGDPAPHIVLEPLTHQLDQIGLGDGPVQVEQLGDGLSNITYRLRRDGADLVLRRPPSASATSSHDVIREGRYIRALGGTDVPVPKVHLLMDDPSVIGVPFLVMDFIDGYIVTGELPGAWHVDEVGSAMAYELVDRLVNLHRVHWQDRDLGQVKDPAAFVNRQLELFARVSALPTSRPNDDLANVGRWLHRTRPSTDRISIVHGDYRLGNVMFSPELPVSIRAILDWELAGVGDPLTDLGYFIGTYPEQGDREGLLLSMAAAVEQPGFPGRDELVARYEQRSGLEVAAHLPWYVAMALWRTAVGLEAIFQRSRTEEAHHPWIEHLEDEVPLLARRAAAAAAGELVG